MKNRFTKFICFSLIFFNGLLACNNNDEPAPVTKITPKVITLTPSTTYQTISGFGAANQMWGSQFPTNSEMKKAYGTDETDLGLSIFRIRVGANANEWSLITNVSKEAKKYNAKILASPWSPPAALKSNASDIGGHLPEANYQAYVNHLNEFTAYMANNNITIDAISIQNEPDIEVSYESCDWTADEMKKFLKNYGQLIQGADVAAPESFNFNQSFTNAILTDDASAANVDIVAGHIYGGGLTTFPLAEQKGKEIWMTEYLMNLNTGQAGAPAWTTYTNDQIWNETLGMLGTMHQSMMLNWNAYIWWYLKRYYSFIGDGTNGTVSGEILKRGYAFSHFSKFVRPGYVRIKTEFQQSSALISAYQGDGKTVVVLINPETAPINNLSIKIGSETPASASRYVTTATSDRVKTTLEKTDGNLLFALEPKSVTTIVIEN